MKTPTAVLLALTLLATPALARAQSLSSRWARTHTPAAATQATTTQPAVAQTARVATGVTVCIVGVAAQGPVTFNLRDGASGAGAILWTVTLSALAGTSECVAHTETFVGTTGNAMTLESAAAPAATNFATAALSGFDTYR